MAKKKKQPAIDPVSYQVSNGGEISALPCANFWFHRKRTSLNSTASLTRQRNREHDLRQRQNWSNLIRAARRQNPGLSQVLRRQVTLGTTPLQLIQKTTGLVSYDDNNHTGALFFFGLFIFVCVLVQLIFSYLSLPVWNTMFVRHLGESHWIARSTMFLLSAPSQHCGELPHELLDMKQGL